LKNLTKNTKKADLNVRMKIEARIEEGRRVLNIGVRRSILQKISVWRRYDYWMI
jgi:hypothetical protein